MERYIKEVWIGIWGRCYLKAKCEFSWRNEIYISYEMDTLWIRNKSLVTSIFEYRGNYSPIQRTLEVAHVEFGEFSINQIAHVSSVNFWVDYGTHMYETFKVYIKMMFGYLDKNEQDEMHDSLVDEMQCNDFRLCTHWFLRICEESMNENNQSYHLMNQLTVNKKYIYSSQFKKRVSWMIWDVLLSKSN